MKPPKVKVKILKDGDQVLNVWHSERKIYIAIRKLNQEVHVYSMAQDENGQPKLSKAPEIIITDGDGVVEALVTDENGNEIFSLTA